MTIITPRLQQHKVMMKKGSSCRYCQTNVDAPGRHSEQCVPLLQTHVLQEAQKQGLDLAPGDYDAKPKTKSKPRPDTEPQLGLQAPAFVLNGFWPIAEIIATPTRFYKSCNGQSPQTHSTC